MGGSRIVVLNLRDALKKLVFVGVALVVVVLLITALMPRGTKDEPETTGNYAPGTYYSEIILHNNPVLVSVTVDETDIIAIDLENMRDTQEVFYPLFQPTLKTLGERIVATQSLDAVTDDENAVTEDILMKAIRSALEQATPV
jgi:uncharacterized protein with FMN-binding domain